MCTYGGEKKESEKVLRREAVKERVEFDKGEERSGGKGQLVHEE